MDTSNLAKWIDELAGSIEQQARRITALANKTDKDTTPFLNIAEAAAVTITDGVAEVVPEANCMISYNIVADTGTAVTIFANAGAETGIELPLSGSVYLKAGQKFTIAAADTGSTAYQIPLTDDTPVPAPEANRTKKTTKKK